MSSRLVSRIPIQMAGYQYDYRDPDQGWDESYPGTDLDKRKDVIHSVIVGNVLAKAKGDYLLSWTSNQKLLKRMGWAGLLTNQVTGGEVKGTTIRDIYSKARLNLKDELKFQRFSDKEIAFLVNKPRTSDIDHYTPIFRCAPIVTKDFNFTGKKKSTPQWSVECRRSGFMKGRGKEKDLTWDWRGLVMWLKRNLDDRYLDKWEKTI